MTRMSASSVNADGSIWMPTSAVDTKRVGLELRGERDPDQLGGAHDVGPEQLAVGQDAVDQGRGIDDQIDGVGQPLPGLLVQAQVGLALVAGDDLQMIGGQFLEVPQQFRVAAVEGLVETAPRIFVGSRPAPGRSACRRPAPSAPAIPGPGSARGSRSPRSAGPSAPRRSGRGSVGAAVSVAASMNLSSVRSPACTSVVL